LLIGLYSDIHGNLDAFAASLDYLRTLKVERLYCGGDVIGYGAYPNECLDIVRYAQGDRRVSFERVVGYFEDLHLLELPEQLVRFLRETPHATVRGNHDHVVLTKGAERFFNDYARTAISWTRDTLNKANHKFVDNLPMTIDVSLNGLPEKPGADSEVAALFRLVHASPYQPERWHYLLSSREIERAFNHLKLPLCFIGHSHQPAFLEQHEDGYIEVITEDLLVPNPFRRYIANMGSVGQPRDGDPRSCVVTLEYDEANPAEMEIKMHRVEYNIDKAAGAILDAQLPAELAGRLHHGM